MKVKDICTRAVRSCTLDTKLAEAGWSMWEGDCGILPVVDDAGKVVGVISDRDICMAVVTRYRPAAEIKVREVGPWAVKTCRLDDDVRRALKTIRQSRVRRLPVVDAKGRLQGILSLNDVALATKSDLSADPEDVTYEDLALALKAVCSRRTAAPADAEPTQVGSGPKE